MTGLDGYIKSQELGYIRTDRIDFAVEKGLIVRDFKLKDYVLTRRALNQYENFLQWLNGNSDKLKNRYYEQKMVKAKETKKNKDIFKEFDNM